jgi:hypothetical protein
MEGHKLVLEKKNPPDKAKPGAGPTAKYFHYSLMKEEFHI